MTKLTIDLDNYSKEDQELMQAIWRKFKPLDKKKESHACDSLPITKSPRESYEAALNRGKNHPSTRDEAIMMSATMDSPKYHESHFLVDGFYEVLRTYWLGQYPDMHLLKYGNVFKTQEAAQRMADRRKRIGIFENKMMEFADGYEWKKGGTHFELVFYKDQWEYECDFYGQKYSPLAIYMTKENAQKAVDWANKHYPKGV